MRVFVGYPTNDMDTALISVYEAPLVNPGKDFVQIITTIEQAVEIRAALDAFISRHGVTVN